MIDVCLEIHHETKAAFLVSEDGNRKSAVWIPKSQATPDKEDVGIGDTVVFTMPEWLAEEKEFI